MKIHHAPSLATSAEAANPSRPTTTLVHDSADARIVLFRIEPKQEVAVHTSPSTVILTIISGSGVVVGTEGERTVTAGDVVTYDPREPHGMRADSERLVIAAAITPRPGSR